MDETTRRRVLAGAAGLGAVATAGCLDGSDAGDDEAAELYGDWFSGVGNFDGTEAFLDRDAIRIAVGAAGGLAFAPPAVRVRTGTRVVWEWTGEGGTHDVTEENGVFESEAHRESGSTFEYTFEETGVYRYVCTPHQASGMRGAVHVVGEEYERA